MCLDRPLYPAVYRLRSLWTPFGGKKAGIERVLQSAFGGDEVLHVEPRCAALVTGGHKLPAEVRSALHLLVFHTEYVFLAAQRTVTS